VSNGERHDEGSAPDPEVDVDVDTELDTDLDEAFAEADEAAARDPLPRTTRRRTGMGGQMIGAAMIGLAEVLQPRPKEEIPIEIANPGEPPNIDKDGLDEPFGDSGDRLVGPPLDRIKAAARGGRPVKRRR
jgi:hypothetical protein